MELNRKTSTGFPSDMMPMKKKDRKWHLEYSKAFHTQHQRLVDATNYKKWKELCEGKQPIDQYKTWQGSRKRAGKANLAWMNLDYSILPIMPKFVKILKNKILEQPKEFKIRAIDPWSVNEERKRKNEIASYMLTKDINDQLKGLGVSIQSPFEEGEAEPANLGEIDLYAEAYPKNKHVSELHDELQLCFAVNKWKHIERDVIDYLVKSGVCGTWTSLDSKGYMQIKGMQIERVITNPVEKNDFSDMTRIGEYLMLSIGQIRVMCKEELNKNIITEKDLAELASKAGGRQYQPMGRDGVYESARDFGSYSAPYDHEKIRVLKWQAKSTDSVAYVVAKDDSGKITIDKRDNPFWLDKKNISDEEYRNFNLQQGLDRKVERLEIENIYQAYWIVDTNHVFSHGLKGDIQRNANSLANAEFDAVLYTTDFDAIARQLEPVIHMAQNNWLKFQHHSSKSVPDGTGINKRALTEITVGGEKLDAMDMIDMRMQTGNFIFKDVDANGRPVAQPFLPMPGSTMDRAIHHLNMVGQAIDLIRNILGLNEATDASAINPERGKAVSELMASNTNTALGDLYFAYNFVYEETARAAARLVPDARKTKRPGYTEALGQESAKYWDLNSDMNFIDWSITIDAGWDEQNRQNLLRAAEGSLKVAGGHLEPTDIYIIEREKNPEKAYMILDAKIRKRKKEEQQNAIMLQQENGKVQQESAKVAEEEKRATLALTEQVGMATHGYDMEKIDREWQYKMLYLKMEKGFELDEKEKELWSNLIIAKDKNRTTERVAMIGAKAKASRPTAK